MDSLFSNWASVIAVMFTTVGTFCTLVWWLAGQFSNIRHLVYDKIDKTEEIILRKLEYHERHDDSRFDSITKDLWDIRVRNARKDNVADDET